MKKFLLFLTFKIRPFLLHVDLVMHNIYSFHKNILNELFEVVKVHKSKLIDEDGKWMAEIKRSVTQKLKNLDTPFKKMINGDKVTNKL